MPAITTTEPLAVKRTAAARSCHFCAQITDSWENATSQTVLAESKSFVAWPSIGALLPGWTLILPKIHVLSLGALRGPELDELGILHKEIRKTVEGAGLGATVAFEHGPSAPGREAGCGVDHAHLHVVPTDADVVGGTTRLFPEIEWREADSIVSATAVAASGDSYLYVEDQDGRHWLASKQDFPSQAIRRVIAADLGRGDEYNWRSYPEPINVQRTIDLFGNQSA